jgi:type IV pilus assembly protein PilO
MNLSDIDVNDLDINNIGNWPGIVKAIVITFVCAMVVGGVIYMDTSDQLGQLEKIQKEEDTLKIRLKAKAAKAAVLNELKAQLEDMREDFKKLSRQLPKDTEVPALLVDISQTGLSSGLEFNLFRPLPERPQEFYAELPIQINVTGTYHEFGNFVSGIAALPRIVTLHNIRLSPRGKGQLNMTATAKTYRYLDTKGGSK